MKSILPIIIAMVILFPFSGCKKLSDHFFHYDTLVVGHCRIAKIVQDEGAEVRTGIVYYNAHNDPDSVIFDFEGSTAGVALFYFRYDDHHRLVEYRSDYSREPDDYFIWHKYIYENDIVVRDTMRARGSGQSTEVGDVHYDLNGRIIKVTSHIIELDYNPVDEEGEPYIYTYDAAGNLEYSWATAYDNKVNFLRTNKVWMLSQRNYSLNNVVSATSYNEFGLPLTFSADKRPDFLINFGPTSIEYECSGK